MKPQKMLGIGLIVVSIVLFVIFSLVKVNFEAQGVFLCQAVSDNPNLDMAQCPAHTSSIPTLVLVGSIISVLLFVAGLYLTFDVKKQVHKRTFASIDRSILSEVEKKIYDFVKENDGSVYQSEIVKETGLSKVKVTRVLDKLEHNDRIIERKRRGMANLVVLK